MYRTLTRDGKDRGSKSSAKEKGIKTEVTLMKSKRKRGSESTLMWFQEYNKIKVEAKARVRIWRIEC